MMHPKRLLAAIAALASVAVLGAGCGSSESHPHPVLELQREEHPPLCNYTREEAEALGNEDELETYAAACE
jgi:hypothetical protein